MIGFFFGSFLIWKKAKEENYEEDKIMDAILLVSLISLIVSRLWFVLINWYKWSYSAYTFFDFVGAPGLSWFGALIGGIICFKLVTIKNKWDFFRIADFCSYGINLALILFSFGCFLDGSGYIWETLLLAFNYRLLYYFDRNYRTYSWYKNKRGEVASGFIFIILIIFFALIRLVVAFIKVPGLFSISGQWESLLAILVGLAFIYFRSGLYHGEIINLIPLLKKIPKPISHELKKRTVKHKFHYKAGMEAK